MSEAAAMEEAVADSLKGLSAAFLEPPSECASLVRSLAFQVRGAIGAPKR